MPPNPPGNQKPDESASVRGAAADDGWFRQVVAQLPLALYATDADGVVTYFNQAAARLVGRQPQLGHDRWCITHRLFHIDGSPLAHEDCPLAVALREGRAVRGIEALAERPDGSRVRFMPLPTPLYDAQGKLTGAVNVLVDVSSGPQVGADAVSFAHHLAEDLSAAIAQKQLHLHYQPVFSAGGNLTGFEALARWVHPERGVIPPSEFIPAAEESGLILPLARELLVQACTEAASWAKPLRIAVNVSPLQFRHGDLPGLIDEVLVETGLEPERLELEITEGVMITDFDRTMLVLHRIKALGVRIALDDFGTGYSSLSYLHMFPLSTLKIDRSFVANLGVASEAAAITRAVIALGHALDIEVVAEGVETREQLDFLIDEGCNYMQGYMLGRPLPAEQYADLTGRKG
ncbi:putative bifunctional diguanylate cyclase/phosphodiesterase [Bosea sp. (in: a-proteobacteria)]|jgi:EAL domain-containing protein (putative c-di-GMP-specific phosphodiesterase class I)|uniref:putative bifunctional diguanylate cyclase/phosphodiesterase n=1 Tax=Bosea sp. (in: a-proteobacteria) TaxID=1871050 RepID=UPI002DDD1964|nr:EAL domain-containing protein [Bosea sp. (in: a-proteobacteria)]HEV2511205.1 EAL domain-containing protein [Bosea sp. (in: a-proteobacteria)]